MKTLIKTIKLLCLMPLLLAIQCDDDVTEETYYIEGKWLLANAGGSELPPNTCTSLKTDCATSTTAETMKPLIVMMPTGVLSKQARPYPILIPFHLNLMY